MDADPMIDPAARRMAQWRGWGLALLVLALAAAALGLAVGQWRAALAPPAPTTIVAASLTALNNQNKLVPFAASFVADPTSRVKRLGLTAQKTLIVPGIVRYELDMAALRAEDLAWDADTAILTVTLPPLRPSAPALDPARAVEYRDGRLVMAVSDAEAQLDAANWAAASAEIAQQAQGAAIMRLAEQAAIQAVRANFALPLAAAGIEARIAPRFDK